ncbi:multidrug ABC transporter permease [Lentilactobacillus fungorum]|uniref:Multidrug ABC transporter permease n=1 Tax=Lentilactobacillus fungorum TaxID=2201250 RepID=A0ABQ3VZQ2_9LACO|nr:ABC transporter permease [Lentilactobacillus fungorum]GHP14388.1 multidrug ABC transporter permease [Lentilactobacillus fungorum]
MISQLNRRLGSELIKLRHLHLLPIILGINILAFFLGSLLYFENQNVFKAYHTQWFALWSEVGLFYAQVFFPLLIALIVAATINSEKERKNFLRMAIVPISAKKLVINKLLSLMVLSALSLICFMALFYMTAFTAHLPINTNITNFFLWGILGWLGTFPIVAIQLWLSIKFERFTTPIIVALGASLLSFILMTMNESFLKVYPYSQIMVGMHVRTVTQFSISELMVFLVIDIMFTGLGMFWSVRNLKKRGFE